MIKKATSILYVENIEPALPFWDALGFERTTEVPHGDELGFVILQKDAVEIMYQTRASVSADVPAITNMPMGGSMVFMEVDDLDSIIAALREFTPVVERRKTFYGADEVFYREPAGNFIGFAAFGG